MGPQMETENLERFVKSGLDIRDHSRAKNPEDRPANHANLRE
jgi:hypothetical protein